MWTVTDGGYEGSPYGYETPSLCRIDAETFTLERVFRFGPDSQPSELQLNAAATGSTGSTMTSGRWR